MQVDTDLLQDPDLEKAGEADHGLWSAQDSIVNGLYLLVLFAAALLRFTELGNIPLSPAEAAEALAAWQFLQPGSLSFVVGSPAYFTLTSLLIPLVGSSDAVVRLVPAVFGLGLITLPWLMRRQIGPVGALVGAAFLAISPLNAISSRTAGGETIALFALLLTTVSVINLHYQFSNRWFYGLAAAVGLGFSSSVLFYGGLLTLGLAWSVARIMSGESVWSVRPDRSTLRNMLVVVALILVALSTRFLTYPSGLGASAQLLGEWIGQFGIGGGLQSILAPFTLLARYEIALLILGLAAVIWTFWRTTTPRIWLTLWLLAIPVLIMIQSGVLENALLATLPGYLLIGLFSAYLVRGRVAHWTWALTAGLLLISAVLFVNLTRYLRISVYDQQDLSNLWFGILALAAAALMLYYFWSMTDASISQGVWLAALFLLMVFECGTAWHLTHSAANDPRENWVTEGTDDDLPVLLGSLQDISHSATNSDADLDLLSAVDTPVLRWYLRDFWQATIGASVPPAANHQVVISRVGEVEPQFGADYVGSDFGLLRTGTTDAPPSGTPIADLLRWWLFHETAVEIIEDRVILWVRADMVLPQQ